MKNNYGELSKIIRESETVSLFMHVNPDGDCVCSALAMYAFLKKLNKTAHCFAPGVGTRDIPEKLLFLPYMGNINAEKPLARYDLAIAVDVGDPGRLGTDCCKIFLKSKISAVIDHHCEYKDFAAVTVRESDSASTTQIIFKIFAEINGSLIDADIASLLYAGLVTDSGSFSFEMTSSETHLIASELLKYGIDSSEINRKVSRDMPPEVFRLKHRILNKAEIFEDGIALIMFTESDFRETGTTARDTEDIINELLNIRGMKVAISVSEIKNNRFKVSFRSRGETDVSCCAKCFGGGGHFHASGCRINGCLEDVRSKLLTAVKEIMSYD